VSFVSDEKAELVSRLL